MSACDESDIAVLAGSALAIGQVDHARDLLSEGNSQDFQKAAEVLVSSGQDEALKFLIKQYELDVDEYYFLHLALFAEQEDTAKMLIGSGADVNRCWEVNFEEDVNIPWEEYEEMRERAYCDQMRISHHLPLDLSVHCSVDMIRFLLQSGADKPHGHLSQHRKATLLIAIDIGSIEKMRLLIDYGADVEAKTDRNETFLIYACVNPCIDADVLQVLLENGANPNLSLLECRNCKQRAIHLVRGNTEKLQLLIQHGAHLEARTSNENTALSLACRNPYPTDCVRILLENGAFPNVITWGWKTPLMLAREENDEEKISLLKLYGALEEEVPDQEERNDQGETGLMLACQRIGDVLSVRHLLEGNASPNLTNQKGETAVHYAVRAGDVEKLQVLVQHNSDVNAMDGNGITPLMKACDEVSVGAECVQFLLESSALPNLTSKIGKTALHCAASIGDVQKVKLLVQYGAHVDAVNVENVTPLIESCVSRDNVECVRFLLQNKASPNLRNKCGYTALHRAVCTGSKEMINVLIQYQADVNAVTDDHATPLMLAIYCSQTDSVRFLLENNALVNLRNFKDYTALHLAAKKEEKEVVELLVQYQADVNASTHWTRTPLMVACKHGQFDCARFLLQNGALPNLRDHKGYTGLHIAVEREQKEIVDLLLQYQADVNTVTDSGRTPLMTAVDMEDFKMAKFLLEAGADVHAVRLEGNTETTILIDLLGNKFNSDCVEFLIRKGIFNSLPEKYYAFLHKMIMADERMLIVLLLTQGMGPTLRRVPFHFRPPLTVSGQPQVRLSDPVSPLTVALKCGKFPVIQYLVGNMVLCPSDLNDRMCHSELRVNLSQMDKNDTADIMDKFYSQPKSLFLLSFVTISHAMGGPPGRVDRVNALPLPQTVKDSLLFKTEFVHMDLTSDNPKLGLLDGISRWEISE